ncbi:MerR family transcriptional regulator [Leclercia tamurae]|uniref:MerR family transcriptional regulator n=1 Tax=Leclercia tamurae TaxID=2926467 RepID=A0ABT2REZ9_9ENTR|nr:MerR family transcriptional regulator [Leclercia tamurae]MCU6679468.1 MerR family transcriptional regulator [Leclercia tamurae]
MAFYSIGDVAERCGINPVTLRAWQRRYGLLKPQRSEGGHRQFDDDDILRIEEIKRWIERGVPVGKVKALLDQGKAPEPGDWSALQEEMIGTLRQVNPTKLRAKMAAFIALHPVETLIDNVFEPLRNTLSLDRDTARAMRSLLDGILIEHAVSSLTASRVKAGRDALLIGWGIEDRTALWLEGWRLSQQGWRIDVFAEPLDLPHPEFFPGQQILVWTGRVISPEQLQQLDHWQKQGYAIRAYGAANAA